MNSSANSKTEQEDSLLECYRKLASSQEPLGKDFEEVLYENLWELYAR